MNFFYLASALVKPGLKQCCNPGKDALCNLQGFRIEVTLLFLIFTQFAMLPDYSYYKKAFSSPDLKRQCHTLFLTDSSNFFKTNPTGKQVILVFHGQNSITRLILSILQTFLHFPKAK